MLTSPGFFFKEANLYFEKLKGAYLDRITYIIHHLYSKDSFNYSHHLQYKRTVSAVVTFRKTNISMWGGGGMKNFVKKEKEHHRERSRDLKTP